MFSNEKVLIGKNKEFDPRKTGNLNTQVLENNSEITEVRKTGRVSIYSKSVAKFGLNTEQTTLFNSFPLPVQSRLLSWG